MIMPMYRTRKGQERLLVGECSRTRGILNITYSKTKDEFAKALTLTLPDVLPSNLVNVLFVDRDYDDRYTMDLEKFKAAFATVGDDGRLRVKIEDLKKVR